MVNALGENRPSVPKNQRLLVLLGEVTAELLSVGGHLPGQDDDRLWRA